jgi:hypothetical protein
MRETELAANGCKDDKHHKDANAKNDIVNHRLTPACLAAAVRAIMTTAIIARDTIMSFTNSLLPFWLLL